MLNVNCNWKPQDKTTPSSEILTAPWVREPFPDVLWGLHAHRMAVQENPLHGCGCRCGAWGLAPVRVGAQASPGRAGGGKRPTRSVFCRRSSRSCQTAYVRRGNWLRLPRDSVAAAQARGGRSRQPRGRRPASMTRWKPRGREGGRWLGEFRLSHSNHGTPDVTELNF